MPDEEDKQGEKERLILEQIRAVKRLHALKLAQEDFLSFVKLTMPDPADPANPDKSRYTVARHHEIMADALMRVEKGTCKRLIITLPPRHGKSCLGSQKFPCWFLGRKPSRQIISSTYSDTFAKDFGREVRNLMKSEIYSQVFPSVKLRKDSQSSEFMKTEQGGVSVHVGMGGAITGRGADLLLIDDPIKNDEEASSPGNRDKQWNWFTQTARTRLMPGGAIVIIMTRWHEDDLVGRLTDPENDFYNKDEAKLWEVIRMPAIAEDENDPLGRKVGEALWPEWYDVPELEEIRRLNPRSFTCLYQNNPAPEEGNFFKADKILTYKPGELPPIEQMRMYCASDHAVSTKEGRDYTVLTPFGVDSSNTVWILPDVWWRRASSDDVVDAMIEMMKQYKPLTWFAERGHISASIGPFLRKRMEEEGVFSTAVRELVPSKDKMTRAQSTRGRMEMGKIRFPGFSNWWAEGRAEILRFPHGKHDDFVDSLSLIGMGLGAHIPAGTEKPPEMKLPRHVGRLLIESAQRADRAKYAMGGF